MELRCADLCLRRRAQFESEPCVEVGGGYVLDGRVGLYIKYSTHRMSPWKFTFHKAHQDELIAMRNAFKEVFLILVCETDGIAVLDYAELREVLSETHESTEWLSVARRKGQQYKVKGSDGELNYKVAESDYPKRVISALEKS